MTWAGSPSLEKGCCAQNGLLGASILEINHLSLWGKHGNGMKCRLSLGTAQTAILFFGIGAPWELVKGPVPCLVPRLVHRSRPGFQVFNGLPRDSDADFQGLLLRNVLLYSWLNGPSYLSSPLPSPHQKWANAGLKASRVERGTGLQY